MLHRLTTTMNSDVLVHRVVELGHTGPIGDALRADGVPLATIGIGFSIPTPFALARLLRVVGLAKPNLIQGWLYHGNLAAQVARASAGPRTPICWNIRQSITDIRREKPTTRAVIRLCATLSGRPGRIIYNSLKAARQHEAIGYCSSHTSIIPNGFDLCRFKPSDDARERIRKELGVDAGTLLVGMIARHHPIKAHAHFLEAAAALRRSDRPIAFVLAGRDVDDSNVPLGRQVRALGLEARVRLLGERADVEDLLAALDLVALPSLDEGFPNILAEAMAAGVPCVATDVGEAAHIIGQTGQVVPPGRPHALAVALGRLIDMDDGHRRQLGLRARERIGAAFALPAIVAQYETLYRSVMAA
jgi:glycosyltransferase involved in cell wall biosynthesis